MKIRVRFILFAALLAVGASLPTKSHATYEAASYNLNAAAYYRALSAQNIWFVGVYDNSVYLSYALNYISAAQSANESAYYAALAGYTGDSDPNGYIAQLNAYYAWGSSYYANIYLQYIAFDPNYFVLWVNQTYLANYYTSVAAYYAGLAS